MERDTKKAQRELWLRVEPQLDILADMPVYERHDAARELADGDEELLRELRSLLAHFPDAVSNERDVLGEGVVESAGGLLAELKEGLSSERSVQHGSLGTWELGEMVAVGGMGRVYRGHRADGLYAQDVAIKLLRWELTDSSLALRFEQERQILAHLEHPGIARLLDGGLTEDGVPFLVMEWVEGQELLSFCDDRSLSVRDRLRLILPVLDAVAAAHRQLVVHRDLKPTNVLVDGDGQPKLLDFGIAKVLGPFDASPVTSTGTGPYTPAYASPEQLRGDVVSTASDVYSLGCVLYVLLTGAPPFSTNDDPGPDPRLAGRIPEAPSRVSTLATSGWQDLDAIVLTALRPEASQRYSGASALARDLERWLEGLPVDAVPPSWFYRTRKFVGRHAVAAALGGLALMSIVGGAGAALIQGRIAAEERDSAERLAAVALDLLRLGDPGTRGASQVPARQLLESGAERAAAIEDVDARRRLLEVIGEGFYNLLVFDRAAETLVAALELPAVEADQGRRVELLRMASRAVAETADLEEALALNQRAVEEQGGVDRKTAADLLYDRAFLIARFSAANSPLRREALALLEQVAEVQSELDPQGSEELATTLHLLGHLRFTELFRDHPEPEASRLNEALEPMRRGIEIRRRAESEDLVTSLNDYALILDAVGRDQDSVEALLETLDVARRTLDPSHPTVLAVNVNLAGMLREVGRLRDSEATYQEVVEAWETYALAPKPNGLTGLAWTQSLLGSLDAAESNVQRALDLLDPADRYRWAAMAVLGDILRRQGRTEEARRVLEETVEKAGEILGPHSEYTLLARESLAAVERKL
ncbi:MAG: serine/threonine-protein kinase [Thermoanaerobaculia bacterium]|nr:serine/threonine-protein kinase [Thermoanaerobaculia bacterium]